MAIEFPADLPWLIFWKCGNTDRPALPRRPVSNVSTSGVTDADEVCPQIPYGATAWRLPGGTWQPIETIPAAWLPFLNRQRPGPMDFRANKG